MVTTVNIPDDVLREAMRHAKAKTEQEAVLRAVDEFNRRHRQTEILKYLGTFEQFVTPDELEAARSGRMRRNGAG